MGINIPMIRNCNDDRTTASPEEGHGTVRIDRIDGIDYNLDLIGKSTTEPVVHWADPCTSAPPRSYRLQWRQLHEDWSTDRSTLVSENSMRVYSTVVPERSAYAVRIVDGSQAESILSSESIVPTPSNLLARKIELIVATYGGRYPWLKEVWQTVTSPRFKIIAGGCGTIGFACAFGSAIRIPQGVAITGPYQNLDSIDDVILSCHDGRLGIPSGQSERRTVESICSGATIVHELAHVYDYNAFGDDSPLPSAITYRFLDSEISKMNLDDRWQYYACTAAELFADLTLVAMHTNGDSLLDISEGYWSLCRQHADQNGVVTDFERFAAEAARMATDAFENQAIPSWFRESFQASDGSWNISAIREWMPNLDSLCSLQQESNSIC